MNFAIFCLILFISQTDCFAAEKRRNAVEEGNKYDLLQGEPKSPSRSNLDEGAAPLDWSEILADVLVKGVNTFLPNHPSKKNNIVNQVPVDDINKGHIVARFCSRILEAYKVLIYDKLFEHTITKNNVVTSTIRPVNRKLEIGLGEIAGLSEVRQDQKEDLEVITIISDVEIIDLEYVGKFCSDCKGINVEKEDEITIENDCPEGLKRDTSGNCADPKSSHSIISVPYQCPIGYEADWFGICREKF